MAKSLELIKLQESIKLNEDSLDDHISRIGRDIHKIGISGFSGYIPNSYRNCCYGFRAVYRGDDKLLPPSPIFFPENPKNLGSHHTYLSFADSLKLFDKVPKGILLIRPLQRNGWGYGNVDGDYSDKSAWIAFAKKYLNMSEKFDSDSWLENNSRDIDKAADSILGKNSRVEDIYFASDGESYSVQVSAKLNSKTLKWIDTYIKPELSSNDSINLRIKTFDTEEQSSPSPSFSNIKGKNTIEKFYSNWTWTKVFSDINNFINILLNKGV